jgi:cell filamentation protein
VSDDPYVEPDTGVFVNLLGLSDAGRLQAAEADLVFARGELLELHPLPGDYDVAHLQAFHRHLFGDVYPWAGDFRTVSIARSASFGDWRHIRTYLDQVFADLTAENHLTGLDREEFVRRLTHYFGEVNAAHPFREGNGPPNERSSASSPATRDGACVG